jgi:hypothetical protein
VDLDGRALFALEGDLELLADVARLVGHDEHSAAAHVTRLGTIALTFEPQLLVALEPGIAALVRNHDFIRVGATPRVWFALPGLQKNSSTGRHAGDPELRTAESDTRESSA